MADLELLFGVKGGGTISGESGKGIKDDLENIVKAIEPLKIKVEADSVSVGKFKDEITKLADHSVQQAKRAQAAWSKVPPNPNGGGGNGGGGGKKNSVLEKDTTEYYKAVTKLEKAQTSLRENLRKWSAASNGKSSIDYQNLEKEEKRLISLGKALDTGRLKAEQFEKFYSKVSASIAISSDNINLYEENESAVKAEATTYNEATKALKAYYDVQVKAVKQRADTYRADDGTWYSESGQFDGLADELNRVAQAYSAIENEVSKLSTKRQLDFFDAISAEQSRLDQAIEAQARKDSASASKEMASNDADAYKRTEAALKAYYAALTDVVKLKADVTRNADGTWSAESAEYEGLVDRLNRTSAEYKELEDAMSSLPVEHQKALLRSMTIEVEKYNEAVDAQSRKDTASADKKKVAADAETYRKAEAALRAYYAAMTEVAKSRGNVVRNDDGTWHAESEHWDALADRLNRTQAEYAELEKAMASLPTEQQQLFFRTIAIEMEKFDQAVAGIDTKAYHDQLSKVDSLLIKTKKNLENWTAAKTGKSSDSYHGLVEMVEVLEAMRKELKEGGVALAGLDDRFAAVSASVRTFAADIELAGENTKSVKTKLGDLAKTLGVSFSIADVFHKAIEIGKQMIDTVEEIDTAMTELKKVTDETDATYERFLSNAEPRARALGATVADVVSASADFARLGNDLPDAADLADAAIVYKNVADGIDDISEASESIVSTMQAFKVEAKDAMGLVDKFNEVNKHAS